MIYNRKEAAARLRKRRKELKLSTSEVARYIDKTPHYYRDIERGVCGMSMETLIGLSSCLDLSLDYISFGECEEETESGPQIAYRLLSQCSDRTQQDAVMLLKAFLDIAKKEGAQ